MIGYLKGKVLVSSPGWVILDVSGVGYKVFVPQNKTYFNDDVLELYTHTQVREDVLALYGFESPEELNFFELLISVSGIGPKVGLAIVSSATVDRLKNSIVNGDPGLISSVSGVGKKTAEKAIIELKSKLKGGFDLGLSISGDSSEVFDALQALGFSKNEISEALNKIDDSLSNEDKIKQALKMVGKR